MLPALIRVLHELVREHINPEGSLHPALHMLHDIAKLIGAGALHQSARGIKEDANALLAALLGVVLGKLERSAGLRALSRPGLANDCILERANAQRGPNHLVELIGNHTQLLGCPRLGQHPRRRKETRGQRLDVQVFAEATFAAALRRGRVSLPILLLFPTSDKLLLVGPEPIVVKTAKPRMVLVVVHHLVDLRANLRARPVLFCDRIVYKLPEFRRNTHAHTRHRSVHLSAHVIFFLDLEDEERRPVHVGEIERLKSHAALCAPLVLVIERHGTKPRPGDKHELHSVGEPAFEPVGRLAVREEARRCRSLSQRRCRRACRGQLFSSWRKLYGKVRIALGVHCVAALYDLLDALLHDADLLLNLRSELHPSLLADGPAPNRVHRHELARKQLKLQRFGNLWAGEAAVASSDEELSDGLEIGNRPGERLVRVPPRVERIVAQAAPRDEGAARQGHAVYRAIQRGLGHLQSSRGGLLLVELGAVASAVELVHEPFGSCYAAEALENSRAAGWTSALGPERPVQHRVIAHGAQHVGKPQLVDLREALGVRIVVEDCPRLPVSRLAGRTHGPLVPHRGEHHE
mmetsp:Transcript_2582/g.6505  ORF Transcript_2582/g.6505 Transcript_2582/m.6505 type:complete len:578 (-) Transcript_2582:280-2013(-)